MSPRTREEKNSKIKTALPRTLSYKIARVYDGYDAKSVIEKRLCTLGPYTEELNALEISLRTAIGIVFKSVIVIRL